MRRYVWMAFFIGFVIALSVRCLQAQSNPRIPIVKERRPPVVKVETVTVVRVITDTITRYVPGPLSIDSFFVHDTVRRGTRVIPLPIPIPLSKDCAVAAIAAVVEPDATVTPEPATWLMVATGLVIILVVARFRKP